MYLRFSLAAILLAVAASTPSSLPYQTLYFDQRLDHITYNPTLPTWSQRYLLNDDFFGSKPLSPSCPGPILLYTGNEGDITAFWSGNGFMIDVLAPKFGALLLFPEQRYYGDSIPTNDGRYEYLSTQQVLEDTVSLLSSVQVQYNASSCPVVAFGGSYGGTLTTFLRVAYPHVVVGGLASSAPVGYYDPAGWAEHGVDDFTFGDIVTKDYDEADPDCLAAIDKAREDIEGADVQRLVEAFGLCDESGLGPHKSDLFLYGLEGLCQQDYPYAIGDNPAWPVDWTCKKLVDAFTNGKDMVKAAGEVTFMSMGMDNSTCFSTLVSSGVGGVVVVGGGGCVAMSRASLF